MQTKLITTEPELLALKDTWNALVCGHSETKEPFFSWDWFYASWQHYGKPENRLLRVVAAFDAEQLLGVLPLVTGTRKSFGVTYQTLEFCNVAATPRHSALVRAGLAEQTQSAIFAALFDELFSRKNSWDMLELANVPENAPFHPFCVKYRGPESHGAIPLRVKFDPLFARPSSRVAAPSASLRYARSPLRAIFFAEGSKSAALIRWKGFVAPFFDVGGTLEDYFATLSHDARRDLRRRMKRFQTAGQARGIRFFSSPDDADQALEQFFEVRKKSWKGAFQNPHTPQFYRDIYDALSPQNQVLVPILSVDDTPVAAGFVLVDDTGFYSLINDHDEAYNSLVPGRTLFVHEVEQLIASSKRRFDFCGTTYAHKEKFADNHLLHSTFQIFHSGLKSRFLFSAKTRWLPLLRKLFRKPAANDLISFRQGR